MTPKRKEEIGALLTQSKYVLVMKGSPKMPACGFSMRAVEILESCGVAFTSINILEDDALRSDLKEYANWPTYPQLWKNGELVGGCDILEELAGAGELC